MRNSRFFSSPPWLASAVLAALVFCGHTSVCTSQDASPDGAEQPGRGLPVPTPYISPGPAPSVPISEVSGALIPVPVTADPATLVPATPDPAAVVPAGPDPVTSDPVTSDPVTSDPATPDPADAATGERSPEEILEAIKASLADEGLTEPPETGEVPDSPEPDELTAPPEPEELTDSPEADELTGELTDEELAELLDMLPPEPGSRSYDASAELKFSFRHAPWESVLEWFAEQAGLSLVQIEGVPLGTFNYSDDKVFTPNEALDLMNSILELKGHTLIRRERMLILHNLEDPLPQYMVSSVSPEELEDRGEYELVKCLFQLEKITPEEAELEIQKLLGPQGSIIVFAKSGHLQVTDTAGRLLTMWRVIQRLEDPEGLEEILQPYQPQTVLPEEIIAVLLQLMDIDPETNSARDGSFRYAVDVTGMRLLLWGTPEGLERVMKLIEAIDPPAEEASPPSFEETLQLIVYTLGRSDPETVLKVMQTLFAEETATGLRLDIDSGTGSLIAYATPAQHARIKATLEYMQTGAVKKIKIFHLYRVDPQLAKIAVEAMYEIGGGGDEEADPDLPVVDYDSTLGQLFVRASEDQLAEIDSLLIQMGEDPEEEGGFSSSQEKVRFIPFATSDPEDLMRQIDQFWPSMRANPLMPMQQPDKIEWLFPGQPTPVEDPMMEILDLFKQGVPLEFPGLGQPGVNPSTEAVPQNWSPGTPGNRLPATRPAPAAGQDPAPKAAPPAAPATPTAEVGRGPFVLVSQAASAEPADPAGAAESTPAEQAPAGELAPIRIFVAPEGLIVTCDDPEALDDFEELLDFLAMSYSTTSTKTVVFGLVHTKAVAIAQTLDQILGGGTLTSASSGGGGSLAGDLASAALGDMGGGIMNSLLGFGGGGGSFAPTGSLRITADSRLNALIVEANSTDIRMIEGLLKILDQKESPQDVLAKSKVQRIPLSNIRAEDVIETVKELYQDRLVTKAGAGGGGQVDPRQLIEALRGGRGGPGGRGGGGQTAEQVEKMSITVDPRSNALLVNAPDALFQEVKLAVEELDRAALESRQSMVVYTLNRTNPAVLQQALSALVGDSVQFNGSGASKSGSSGAASPTPATPAPGQSPADIQRRMEFFRALQRAGGGGPPGGGRPGSGTGGGRPGGFGGGRPSPGGPRPSGR